MGCIYYLKKFQGMKKKYLKLVYMLTSEYEYQQETKNQNLLEI